ncbi:MAG TPA: bifunctional sugar-1-phosphate nucleotidylyltransferase/acetyltransferase [Methanomassiliicoccales archaeon]|nr:bifunctional sugar-1-phosphate nucleotidylyltransferase/acetyltransferase [Methanomassiliicoccales archaeon]
MKALILAAGDGTRLRPLTSNKPKPLLTVAGKPYLAHLVQALKDAGIKDQTILVGWKSNKVREFFGDGQHMGVDLTYLEQKERLGTANAIGVAEGIIQEDFVCVNGDVVMAPESIAELVTAFQKDRRPIMGTVEVPDPSRFGVVEQKDGKLVRVWEKPSNPPSNLINGGIFGLTPEVFDLIHRTERSSRGEYEFTDTLNMMSAEMDVRVHRIVGEWIDVGYPWELLRANEYLMGRLKRNVRGTVEEGAVIKGNVVVEEGAVIRSGSYIEGPVYISKGCDVGPNCYIRPSTCLGEGVKVGNAVEVKNSIIMQRTNVPHHNYIGDSVIGERCNFGSGTKVANLRFDDRAVRVSTRGQLINSGRRKLGAIIGDDVKTGINAMIEPGAVIWEGTIIGMGALARGNIGPNSRVL